MSALEIAFHGPSAGSCFVLVAVAAFATVVPRRPEVLRVLVALLGLAVFLALRGDLALVAAWLALGLVERREDGAVPLAGRVGDLAMLLLLLGLPTGGWRAFAVVAVLASRAGAWPCRAPDPVSAVAVGAAALAGLSVTGWSVPALPVVCVALATTVAAAVRPDPDRALVRAAAAHAVLSALVVGLVPGVVAVHVVGFGLLVCGRTRTGVPARICVLLGAGALVGVPLLPGFVAGTRAFAVLKSGPAAILVAAVATHVLLGATVVRVGLARLDGARRSIVPGGVALAGIGLLVGVHGLTAGGWGGGHEVVVVLAAAGTSIGLGYLLSAERALTLLRGPERLADRLATAREAIRRGVHGALDADRGDRPGPILRPAVDALASAASAVGRRPIASLLVALTLALALLLVAPQIGGILGCSPR